jgi:tRNA 2-thiouridine synthesizing protein C
MKKLLIISRQAPYGTAYGKEALDAVLMASAFASVTVLFMDDGIFQLKNHQVADRLEIKDYSPTFAALDQYGVKDILVSFADLTDRGLTESDLVIPTNSVSDGEIRQVMQDSDMVLSF